MYNIYMYMYVYIYVNMLMYIMRYMLLVYIVQ